MSVQQIEIEDVQIIEVSDDALEGLVAVALGYCGGINYITVV
jgi:hypothetical protein